MRRCVVVNKALSLYAYNGCIDFHQQLAVHGVPYFVQCNIGNFKQSTSAPMKPECQYGMINIISLWLVMVLRYHAVIMMMIIETTTPLFTAIGRVRIFCTWLQWKQWIPSQRCNDMQSMGRCGSLFSKGPTPFLCLPQSFTPSATPLPCPFHSRNSAQIWGPLFQVSSTASCVTNRNHQQSTILLTFCQPIKTSSMHSAHLSFSVVMQLSCGWEAWPN